MGPWWWVYNNWCKRRRPKCSDFSEFKTVRYFPDSLAKNCYRFAAMPNMTYMIRGTFFYGSYDNATKLPSFQMAIYWTLVANVTFDDPTIFVYHEITFMTQLNNVTFLCLLRDSSNSVPFISAICFWSLPDGFWNANVAAILGEGVYFKTKYRLNIGGNDLVRYVTQIILITIQWFLQVSSNNYRLEKQKSPSGSENRVLINLLTWILWPGRLSLVWTCNNLLLSLMDQSPIFGTELLWESFPWGNAAFLPQGVLDFL